MRAHRIDPLAVRFARAATRSVAVPVVLACAIAGTPLGKAIALAKDLPASTAATPPGMTMHRTQAGTPDRTGWVEAASSEGAFGVTLPCRFNDFTFEDASESARAQRTDTVGCATANGRRFSATRIRYRGGARDAEAALKRMRTEAPWRGATQRIATFQEHPMVESTFEDERRCGYMRVVHVAPELLSLIVESPKAGCPGLGAASRRFFDSLVLGAR